MECVLQVNDGRPQPSVEDALPHPVTPVLPCIEIKATIAPSASNLTDTLPLHLSRPFSPSGRVHRLFQLTFEAPY